MHISREELTPTRVKLTINVENDQLRVAKQAVLTALTPGVKVPGFRPGKAPAHLVEKSIDQSVLQADFIDRVVNDTYVQAVQQEQLRPVAQPDITLIKFVPYDTMEYAAEVDVVGPITLADYKKIKLARQPVKVEAKDVTEVLENLRQRGAERKDVTRAAKDGDELIIDFRGSDTKSGEPIQGADGSQYPLQLGSKQFIPGFEDELIGAKAGATKSFDLTFPDDYGMDELQGRKVTFAVTVHKVQELQKPKLDDAFAATIGSFKTLGELKADIKKQLTAERQQEADRQYDNELLEKITAKSTLHVPNQLIEEEIDRIESEEKRNLVYRGQTWEEHLAAEGITAEAHREKQRDNAELRVKAGLVLSEIAEKEQVQVTQPELEARLEALRSQYTDPAMQAELAKPENIRDVNSRLLTEKTLDTLRSFATAT